MAEPKEKFIHTKLSTIDVAGDLIAGILLGRILFWSQKDTLGHTKLRVQKEGHYWLAKRQEDWYNEIRITPKQYRRAIKLLEEKGLVITKRFCFKGAPTTHIWLDMERYSYLMQSTVEHGELSQGEGGTRAESDYFLTKGENACLPKGEKHIDERSKTITGNTPENTNIPIRDKEEGVATGDRHSIFSPNEDVKSFIHWYRKRYKQIKGKPHPDLKRDQLIRVHDTLFAYMKETGCDTDALEEMAESFFYKVKQSDHNINHFATQGMLEIRFFDSVY